MLLYDTLTIKILINSLCSDHDIAVMDIPEVIFPGAGQSNSQLQRRFEPEQEKKPGEAPARPKVGGVLV